jgi:hypothetical protein
VQPSTRLLFLLPLLLYSVHLHSQTDSTIIKSVFPTRQISERELDRNRSWRVIDTGFVRNEIYHPMYEKYGLFQDLGNIGTPAQSLIFRWPRTVDFNLCLNPFEAWFKKPTEATYYSTKVPYTDLSYVQGRNELIYLKAKHAQNITPRLNIGVDYFRLTSQGFYLQQYTSSYHTQVFGSFQSKSNRYALIGNLTWNKGVLDESGGIQSDSVFESLRGANKTVTSNLSFSQTRYKNRAAYFKQYYRLGPKQQVIHGDDTSYTVTPLMHFSHTIKLEEMSYYFDNGTSAGFDSSYLFPVKDSAHAFFDSIYYGQVMNRFAWSVYGKSDSSQRRYFEVGVAHKYIYITQPGYNYTYNNITVDGVVEREGMRANDISLYGYGSYCLTGYNQYDTKLQGDLAFKTTYFNVNGGLANHLMTPDFTFVHFHGTPFQWDKNFSKINLTTWRVQLQTKVFRNNFNIRFDQFLISNWVYFNENALPEQTSKLLVIQTVELRKLFRVWKLFFDHRLIYQKTNLDIIRLPEFGGMARYYFESSLFRKAFGFQVGFDLFYNTAYKAYAYNPDTRAFYLQNEKTLGNYPVLDVFINGEIKKAILFVKYEHVNQGWINEGYYYTYHYPLPLAAFRLGVRWRMYN